MSGDGGEGILDRANRARHLLALAEWVENARHSLAEIEVLRKHDSRVENGLTGVLTAGVPWDGSVSEGFCWLMNDASSVLWELLQQEGAVAR